MPDYFVLSLISLWRTRRLSNVSAKRALYWLHSLPPHNHELLWLPLLGHDHILAAAFRADAQVTWQTLQQMRSSSYPGLRRTVLRALPQIVTDQLLAAASITDLIATATPKHPFLRRLVPRFYQLEEESSGNEISFQLATSAPVNAEIAIMLPRLQRVARDVRAALQGGSAHLRKRGLKNSLNKLADLQGELPSMALDASAISRWEAVLQHWQSLIQSEIQQQGDTLQGEVLRSEGKISSSFPISGLVG